jgi:hypothetical protein
MSKGKRDDGGGIPQAPEGLTSSATAPQHNNETRPDYEALVQRIASVYDA